MSENENQCAVCDSRGATPFICDGPCQCEICADCALHITGAIPTTPSPETKESD